MNTTFEKFAPNKLGDIHRAISHDIELLQQKMAADMGRVGYLDILPRNFGILPIEKCSLQDVTLLEELHEKAWDCLWTKEKKEAKDLKRFNAEFKFWSFMEVLTDDERNSFFNKVNMSSLEIIQQMIYNPNFLNEVCAL